MCCREIRRGFDFPPCLGCGFAPCLHLFAFDGRGAYATYEEDLFALALLASGKRRHLSGPLEPESKLG